jgi:transketolase
MRMLRASGAGHAGGALSCLDIVTAIYFHALRHDPEQPKALDRDRFILSAGHKCLAQYAVLAEAGYFDPAWLDSYGQLNTHLPGHPDMAKLAGIEANTGSLGHGLSIAVGMALGLRHRQLPSRVYTVLGDGELPEGSNWEAAAAAAHHKLDRLTAIVDSNGLQISGRTAEIMNTDPLEERFAGFGWATVSLDGHDMAALIETLTNLPLQPGQPTAIIARTTKAKGLSFGEGKVDYHYWKPKPDQLEQAEAEIAAQVAEAWKAIAS